MQRPIFSGLSFMAATVVLTCTASYAAGVPTQELDPVVVIGQQDSLIGNTESATIGVVYAEQFENRALTRPGELLEVVPGLIVTQHSGEGKANQYFLRGFNLDHGTDFATWVEGMPVNMPTHGHGQGYSDVGFLIPELVDTVEYRKGPYYAEVGDFSAAGAAFLRYRDSLEAPFLTASTGAYGYNRLLAAGSMKAGGGTLLAGVEGEHYNASYQLKENYRKANGVLRYSQGDADQGFNLTLMGFTAKNNSPDQIPLRAVQDGRISRRGFIDPTDGGDTYRYSLSGGWHRKQNEGEWLASGYAIRYHLNLFSDFTYFLDDAVNGDQFEQLDTRTIAGGQAAYRFIASLGPVLASSEAGVQTRHDNISPLTLFHTQARQRLGTVRRDEVQQTSAAIYAKTTLRLSGTVRALIGARYDRYNFDVSSNLAANSGKATDLLFSPKLGLIFGPFEKTEYFLNYGRGFHSNDGRGSTITVDPNDGVTPANKVNPLVRARGVDLGLRSAVIDKVQLAFSLFHLDIDSELVFSGDGGTTQASRASRRRGAELAVYWRPLPPLVVDADLAYARTRFTQDDPVGDRIPGSAEGVAAAGLTYAAASGFDIGLRLRYFGPRPLIEDNSQRSRSTTIVNAHAGYHFNPRLQIAGEVLNLFNSKDNDIDYFYTSRLPGEPAQGVDDIHFHPVEPINGRLLLTYKFQ